jgi:predicted ATP-dependent endonuclease of OLD family
VRLSRLVIKNFRNFKRLDVRLADHAVFLGENKVGKTNLLFAIRLVLHPSLPDSARRLRLDDFWDGLPRPLTQEDVIEISLEFEEFEKSENLLAVLADHLVQPEPIVSTRLKRPSGFAPTEPEKLVRALQLMIDAGKRGIAEASLYLALKQLEQHLVEGGERLHTFLAIEEWEAHLHPPLQRLIYRNYLRTQMNPKERKRSEASC